MKIWHVALKNTRVPSPAKRDALLLSELFLLNCFAFSAWPQLGQVLTKPWLPLIWLYGLGALVPLAWRDKAPATVFASQWVLTMAAWPIMHLYTPIAGIPVALYAVSAYCTRTISLVTLLVSFIPNLLCAAVAFRLSSDPAQRLHQFTANAIVLVAVTLGAWAAGRVTQAIQQHVQSLERQREVTRQAQAVGAERRRIARELHDIVSHAVTVIVLQAAGATRIADTDYIQVAQSLKHIETTGKQAMVELRRLLGVLSDTPRNDEAALQHGLADLPLLLTSFRDTGLIVTVHVEGTPHPLNASIDLVAYRIVQEGLTNALKHSGKNCRPCLRLVWAADSLHIQIDNDTNPAQAPYGPELSIGRGLTGLHERAQAVGGHLQAGTLPNGSYRLAATLPLVSTAQRAVLEHTL